MKIGLDLSVIQTPHRMRGIGSTAINFVNNMPKSIKSENSFVIYLYNKDRDLALSLLHLSDLDYEVRDLTPKTSKSIPLPGRLRIINSIINNLIRMIDRHLGDSRAQNISGIDAYLQFDPMQPLPRSRNIKRGLMVYDLIPYIMESDYLWSYKTARKHQLSRRAAFRKDWQRRQYIKHVTAVGNSADRLFAISQHTKEDYIKYTKIPKNKILVTYLGIDHRLTNKKNEDQQFEQYIDYGWGYLPESINLETKRFLLFLGGADPRRKLVDLVAAYNNLKARGFDIRLVLAGDTMKGPLAIPVPEVQKYILQSSYSDDIIFLGFVNDKQREWLYENAIAFIYPSAYEGFGLPILEAMQYGTPVITYKNSSIHEIAKGAAIYATDFLEIANSAEQLLSSTKLSEKHRKLGIARASEFSWDKTVLSIVNGLKTS